MPIRTRRWNDKGRKDDGMRILICRYRPRALPKNEETWDLWWKELGPSAELHAAFYGKSGTPITWEEYRRRYLEEMASQAERINVLAEQVADGKMISLLCSSACEEVLRCHRSLLRGLIEEQANLILSARAATAPPQTTPG